MENSAMAGPGVSDHASNIGFGTVDQQRLLLKKQYEQEFASQTIESQIDSLSETVQQLCKIDPYIGCVAQSEVHFWKAASLREQTDTDEVAEVMLGDSPGQNNFLMLGKDYAP